MQLPERMNCNYLRLYSLQGQLLREKRRVVAVFQRLATNDLPGGVYLLVVGYEDTQRATRKVVKIEQDSSPGISEAVLTFSFRSP